MIRVILQDLSQLRIASYQLRKLRDLKFDKALGQLREINQKLEGGNLELEEGIKLYKKGVELYKLCQKKLKEAEAVFKEID